MCPQAYMVEQAASNERFRLFAQVCTFSLTSSYLEWAPHYAIIQIVDMYCIKVRSPPCMALGVQLPAWFGGLLRGVAARFAYMLVYHSRVR